VESSTYWQKFELALKSWLEDEFLEREFEQLELIEVEELPEADLIQKFSSGVRYSQSLAQFIDKISLLVIQNSWRNLASVIVRIDALLFLSNPKSKFAINMDSFWSLIALCKVDSRHIRFDNATRIVYIGMTKVFSFDVEVLPIEHQNTIVKHLAASSNNYAGYDHLYTQLEPKIVFPTDTPQVPIADIGKNGDKTAKVPNTKVFRGFLEEAFSDEEILVFCYDNFADLRNKVSDLLPKTTKIQLLIEYCNTRQKFDLLANLLADERPEKYKSLQVELFT
jgi:hypothetical protein